MTEQDAVKLAELRDLHDEYKCKETCDEWFLLRMLDEANERARQMREAIVELTTFHKKSEMGTWMERSKAAWERIEAIAASPPSGESALRKAARYEKTLREIADATACPCHCPTVMEIAAAALEGGEGA